MATWCHAPPKANLLRYIFSQFIIEKSRFLLIWIKDSSYSYSTVGHFN